MDDRTYRRVFGETYRETKARHAQRPLKKCAERGCRNKVFWQGWYCYQHAANETSGPNRRAPDEPGLGAAKLADQEADGNNPPRRE